MARNHHTGQVSRCTNVKGLGMHTLSWYIRHRMHALDFRILFFFSWLCVSNDFLLLFVPATELSTDAEVSNVDWWRELVTEVCEDMWWTLSSVRTFGRGANCSGKPGLSSADMVWGDASTDMFCCWIDCSFKSMTGLSWADTVRAFGPAFGCRTDWSVEILFGSSGFCSEGLSRMRKISSRVRDISIWFLVLKFWSVLLMFKKNNGQTIGSD